MKGRWKDTLVSLEELYSILAFRSEKFLTKGKQNGIGKATSSTKLSNEMLMIEFHPVYLIENDFECRKKFNTHILFDISGQSGLLCNEQNKK